MRKCVVFDLDETIGYFSQLYKITKTFEQHTTQTLNKKHIIDLYKYFYNIFRPGIFTLLAYVKFLKEKYNIQIILYTNTIMDNIWLDSFLEYTYNMVKLKFDNTMHLHSKCRKSIKKNLQDLYNCNISLNSSSPIMIIDNKEHKLLKGKNITYCLVNTFYFMHDNNVIWKKLHDMFNITITKPLENNTVSKDYNDIIKKSSNNETLDIIYKLKVFSKQ